MYIEALPEVGRRTRRLRAADVERLLEATRCLQPDKNMNRPDKENLLYRYILLLVLFRHGWRNNETLRVHWSRIDLIAGEFGGFECDKGDAEKTLDMNPAVFEALASLPQGEPERAERERRGRVFSWVNRNNVYGWFKPWCKTIGVEFTPHMARVEFASQLSDCGKSHTVIADVGTWTDIRAVDTFISKGVRQQWDCGGQEFDPPRLHQFPDRTKTGLGGDGQILPRFSQP